MFHRTRRALFSLPLTVVAAFAALASHPAAAAICTIDPVPAATLLYPFFEVDLDNRQLRNTVLAVENVSEAPIVAHVTVWSDWAIPVLVWDVYLAGYDVQTIDLAAAFLDGVLTTTGSAVSPHGPLSAPPVAFSGCNNGTSPGTGPVYANPALAVPLRNHVQAALTGRASPLSGRCNGANHGDNVARGYVTIDANDQCTLLFPSDTGYFNVPGPTSRRNVLAGDLSLRHPPLGAGPGYKLAFPAVAIEAVPEGQQVPGGRTFYGRYVNGSGTDGREPLPTIFEPRALDGGAFFGGTTLFVWRETVAGTPADTSCGSSPLWAPLSTPLVPYFDELENVVDVSQSFPIAVNVEDAVNPQPFGRALLDLQHPGVTPIYGGPKAQAWVAFAIKGIASGMGFAHTVPATHHPVSCTP